MRAWIALGVTLALAGCLSGGGGADDDILFGDTHSRPVQYTNLVQVVGVGVPGQFCNDEGPNSQVLTWTIEAPEGATDIEVRNLVIEIEGADTVNDVDLFLTGPGGDDLGSSTGSANAESISVAGPGDAGDYLIEVRGCSGAGSVAVSGTASLVWTPATTP